MAKERREVESMISKYRDITTYGQRLRRVSSTGGQFYRASKVWRSMARLEGHGQHSLTALNLITTLIFSLKKILSPVED